MFTGSSRLPDELSCTCRLSFFVECRLRNSLCARGHASDNPRVTTVRDILSRMLIIIAVNGISQRLPLAYAYSTIVSSILNCITQIRSFIVATGRDLSRLRNFFRRYTEKNPRKYLAANKFTPWQTYVYMSTIKLHFYSV